MKTLLTIASFFCLWGCAHEQVKAYSYCVVKRVDESKAGDQTYSWTAHCDDGSVVVFSRMIHAGEGVYYSPYFENDDTYTMRGYIQGIDKIVP